MAASDVTAARGPCLARVRIAWLSVIAAWARRGSAEWLSVLGDQERQHGERVLFAMAYGGNGITYSVLGATLLRALIERESHPLAALHSFARM